MTADAMAAALLQLSEHAERLALIDAREADHFRAISDRLNELGTLISGARRDAPGPGRDPRRAGRAPASRSMPWPPGWPGSSPTATAMLPAVCPGAGAAVVATGGRRPRQEALDKVRAWVEQVYRPGYGQLAATLGPCWEQHPLCLYGLDVLSELWSVLYLQAGRSAAMLSAQAEYQARIVPAIAEQLMTETTRCGHAAARRTVRRRPERVMSNDHGASLAQALAYARRGWPVFPCKPGRKEPDTPHGFKDATTDPGRITAWWTAVPGRNVAIATGAPGPDVLDVDVRPGGSGYPAYRRLQRAGLLEGSLAIVATPSGGLHAYYAGTGQASGRLPGRHLDFKACRRVRPRPAIGRRRQALPADPAPAGPPGGRRAARLGRRHHPAGPASAAAARHAAARPCRCRPAGRLGRPAARGQPERRPVLGRLPRR